MTTAPRRYQLAGHAWGDWHAALRQYQPGAELPASVIAAGQDR